MDRLRQYWAAHSECVGRSGRCYKDSIGIADSLECWSARGGEEEKEGAFGGRGRGVERRERLSELGAKEGSLTPQSNARNHMAGQNRTACLPGVWFLVLHCALCCGVAGVRTEKMPALPPSQLLQAHEQQQPSGPTVRANPRARSSCSLMILIVTVLSFAPQRQATVTMTSISQPRPLRVTPSSASTLGHQGRGPKRHQHLLRQGHCKNGPQRSRQSVDIVVASAASTDELSRLRIVSDAASS